MTTVSRVTTTHTQPHEPAANSQNSVVGVQIANVPVFVPQPPRGTLTVRPGIEMPRRITPQPIVGLTSLLSFIGNKFHYTFRLEAGPKAVMNEIYTFVYGQNNAAEAHLAFAALATKLYARYTPADICTIVEEEKSLLVEAFGNEELVEDFVLALYKGDGNQRDARWFCIIVKFLVGEDLLVKAAHEYVPSTERRYEVQPKRWITYLNGFYAQALRHRLYSKLRDIVGSEERLAQKIGAFATAYVTDVQAIMARQFELMGRRNFQTDAGLFGGATLLGELEEATRQFTKFAFVAGDVTNQQLFFSLETIFLTKTLLDYLPFVRIHYAVFSLFVRERSEWVKAALGQQHFDMLQIALRFADVQNSPAEMA